MPGIENLEFLNSNELRAFPLKADCARVSGVFSIPDSFIVDLSISATSDPSRRFYISRIRNSSTLIQVELSDASTPISILGVFDIPVTNFQRNSVYILQPSAAYVGATGKLVVGNLTNILRQPSGTFIFSLATAEVEMSTIVPSLRQIDRINFTDSTENISFSLTGDVKILARNNIRFSHSLNTNTSVIDVGDGLGLNKACNAADDAIRTINGVSPNAEGEFWVTGVDCVDVEAATNGISLTENCCKPCMGCNEIGELTDRLVQIETELLDLRDYYIAMKANVDTFTTSINFDKNCD